MKTGLIKSMFVSDYDESGPFKTETDQVRILHMVPQIIDLSHCASYVTADFAAVIFRHDDAIYQQFKRYFSHLKVQFTTSVAG